MHKIETNLARCVLLIACVRYKTSEIVKRVNERFLQFSSRMVYKEDGVEK